MRELAAVAVLMFVAAPARSEVEVPAAEELEKYVLSVPKVTLTRGAEDLKKELAERVEEYVSRQWAPLVIMPGKADGSAFFTDPTLVFESLGMAYPYLPARLQAKVRDYLAEQAKRFGPVKTWSLPWNQGEPRQRFAIGPRGSKRINPRQRHRLRRVHAMWVYGHRTGDWDLIRKNWGGLRQIVNRHIKPDDVNSLLIVGNEQSVNARPAALIALTRMARQLGDEQTCRTALGLAGRALAARLEYENRMRPSDGQWEAGAQNRNKACKFLATTWNAGCWIPRYRGLTPTIGRVLRDRAAEDIERTDAYADMMLPARVLACSAEAAGEISHNFPPEAMEQFLAKAYLSGLPGRRLRYYLDIPWCPADPYYIQKLVITLETHGETSWVRLPGL